MIMIANLQYAWTLFVKPIQAETGWGLPEIQGAFALFILFQTWVQPLDGWLIDRFGPRGFISVAGLLCGLGWAGMGYATSLPMLYTMYCIAGVGAAFVYSGSIGSALKWFKERRGLAAGIMAAGFGGGTALFIQPISSMIESQGYQSTFVATGLLQGVVILVVAQFLRHPPAAARHGSNTRRRRCAARTPSLHDAGDAADAAVLPDVRDVRPDGQRRPPVTANAGPIAGSWGFTAGPRRSPLSPLANGASRVFWGWASDRLGRETTMVIAFLLQAVCLFLVMAVGQISGAWFALTLVLVYFTWGEIYSLFPSATADYFGTRHATSNYAVLYTAKGVASIIGGWFGAFLYEQTGSWAVGFYGSAAMALVAAVMAIGLRATSASTRRAGASVPAAGAK